jgi:hypothetical protein
MSRPKTASWVGFGGESVTLGSPHHLHVAAGEAGATFLERPENAAFWSMPRFAAPALLAAAWRSRVPPGHPPSPFLSDPRRSLGSAY